MDIFKTLGELYEEKRRLDLAIAMLEGRTKNVAPITRRGRKSMSGAERKAVSARMKQYWETRRRAQTASVSEGLLATAPAREAASAAATA